MQLLKRWKKNKKRKKPCLKKTWFFYMAESEYGLIEEKAEGQYQFLGKREEERLFYEYCIIASMI